MTRVHRRRRRRLSYEEWCQRGREAYLSVRGSHPYLETVPNISNKTRRKLQAANPTTRATTQEEKSARRSHTCRRDLGALFENEENCVTGDDDDEQQQVEDAFINVLEENDQQDSISAVVLSDDDEEQIPAPTTTTTTTNFPSRVFPNKPRRTFSGRRRKRRFASNNSKNNNNIQLEIPPSQYWAVVEGLVDDPDPQAYMEDLLLASSSASSTQLPTRGRVLELFPVEALPGTWTATVVTTLGGASAIPSRLGWNRRDDDWKHHRLVLRHADHNNICSPSQTQQASTVDPSLHRASALQALRVTQETTTFCASLSLVAFDGFLSVAENSQAAPHLVSAVLQECRRAFDQQHHEKSNNNVFALDKFTARDNKAVHPTEIQGAGGVCVVGNIVNHYAKKKSNRNMDYKVVVLRDETSNRVVGLDVIFVSGDDSTTTVLPSPSSVSTLVLADSSNRQKRRKVQPLTSHNLQLHEKSCETSTSVKKKVYKTAETYSEGSVVLHASSSDTPQEEPVLADKNMLMAPSEDQFRKEVTALANIQGPRATECPPLPADQASEKIVEKQKDIPTALEVGTITGWRSPANKLPSNVPPTTNQEDPSPEKTALAVGTIIRCGSSPESKTPSSVPPATNQEIPSPEKTAFAVGTIVGCGSPENKTPSNLPPTTAHQDDPSSTKVRKGVRRLLPFITPTPDMVVGSGDAQLATATKESRRLSFHHAQTKTDGSAILDGYYSATDGGDQPSQAMESARDEEPNDAVRMESPKSWFSCHLHSSMQDVLFGLNDDQDNVEASLEELRALGDFLKDEENGEKRSLCLWNWVLQVLLLACCGPLLWQLYRFLDTTTPNAFGRDGVMTTATWDTLVRSGNIVALASADPHVVVQVDIPRLQADHYKESSKKANLNAPFTEYRSHEHCGGDVRFAAENVETEAMIETQDNYGLALDGGFAFKDSGELEDFEDAVLVQEKDQVVADQEPFRLSSARGTQGVIKSSGETSIRHTPSGVLQDKSGSGGTAMTETETFYDVASTNQDDGSPRTLILEASGVLQDESCGGGSGTAKTEIFDVTSTHKDDGSPRTENGGRQHAFKVEATEDEGTRSAVAGRSNFIAFLVVSGLWVGLCQLLL